MKNLSTDILIEIEQNLCKKAKLLIYGLGYEIKDCLMVSDKKIFNKYHHKFDKNFIASLENMLIFNQPQADQNHVEKIINIASKVKLIIAFGSGTINDLCKYSAKKLGIKYLVFATAPSMNGYASINASITINQHKKTLLATLPQAILIDLEIIKSAPKKMIRAGIADALCIYSCMFDWQLSHLICNTNFDSKCFEIQQDILDYLFKNYHKFELNNLEFLTILSELLISSGKAMTIANGSYPASQSEHLIAHCLELKYPRLKKILHGQLIAITLATSLKIQQQVLTKINNHNLILKEVNNNWQDLIKSFFNKKIAKECIDQYFDKIKKIEQTQLINDYLKKNNQLIYHKLNQIYQHNQQVLKVFQHFKINQNLKLLAISNRQYDLIVKKSKFIRNRFTCLDLY